MQTGRTMEFVDITSRLQQELAAAGAVDGVCHLYNPHTTAGLTINEGADPAVRSDLIAALRQVVPMDFPYRHLEGNSPAHLMATLCGSSVTVFVDSGRLALGTWQKIYFCEFDGPRSRKVSWRFLP
ncbi:MAG: secondary thiamine-phosphate synthase enzyme YjbQ [Desulfobulbaceae bacterium]|nr:secondary thiamine-phosphate synthase enzyme YjbQ [Desulfobulbaceae bacterium]